MGCCSIYNKSFLLDADLSSAAIDIDKLKNIVPRYSSDTSGIWQPIIINYNQTNLNKVDFLREAGDSTASSAFDPLNCSSPAAPSYSALIDTGSFDCSYCEKTEPQNYKMNWYLKDSDGNIKQDINNLGERYNYVFTSDCCSGACDTRVGADDIIPKIPVLNQNYLNKFYDFKYHKQFPASSNAGLGFNEFIKINGSNISSFSSSPDLVIDWRLKETISEIPYDRLQSQFNNLNEHQKSYKKSKIVSNTCGNFILTKINPDYTGIIPDYSYFSGLILNDNQSIVSTNLDDVLPTVENFTVPYGFEKYTYNNIFIKTKKIASHWKWHYDSGVLCWYRYYNKDMINDPRPISGVDLYISPGDVFHVRNDGPEPAPTTMAVSQVGKEIKPCPSGLKIIDNGAIACVIPSGSQFTYISQNIYPKFIEIFNRINLAAKTDDNNMSMKEKFHLAALLCTAPEYDNITLDLMSRNKTYQYNINSYFQIDVLNKDMLRGTPYGSVSKLNYIKNKTDLINTLADKYGAYLWCPPNSTSTIKLKDNIDSQCYIQLDFDVVALSNDVKFINSNCSPTQDCSQNIPNKIFAYGQKFKVGQSSVDIALDTRTRYKIECSGASRTATGSARTAGLYINNQLLTETIYSSGCYIFQNNYPRILTESTPTETCCNASGINCAVCDDDSTYNLVGGAELLCKPYQGDLSFCDPPSARFYNNSEGANVVGTRPGRNILNNTIYFKRSYPAVAFNPHLDNIAFHHQGGIYYSNSLFGNLSGTTVFQYGTTSLFDSAGVGDVEIQFLTKDVGIKIYLLNIEKLRGSGTDTYNCRSFPIKDRCKCFGLSTISSLPYVCNNGGPITFTNNPILYTPNISTTFSPKIKAYGGYTENKINELFGGGEISSQIKVLKKEIENLNKTINFMELSDLAYDINGISLQDYRSTRLTKSGEIDNLVETLAAYRIPNHPDPETYLIALDRYINPLKPYGDEKSVTINLKNYVTTNYAVQLPSYNTVHADIWAKVNENVDFTLQRYTTKVTVNNTTTIYDQQKKVIPGSSSSINVKLSNPYLEALLGGENILYPPQGSLCSSNSNFGSKGDQINSVAITFSRIPRKQLLSFYIAPPKAMGVLKKGFFHPNSGLIDRKSSDPAKTCLYNISGNIFIDYDQNLFSNSDSFFSNGIIYYDKINPSVQRVISQIGQFSNHRKPRLYLQLNNVWYEYVNHDLFGFYNQNVLNIGKPFIFEYLDKETNQSITGPWLPTSVKKHIDFNFIYNFNNKQIPIFYQYPIVYKNAQKPEIIKIEGNRTYFYVQEIDSARVSLSNSITTLSQDDQDNISLENPEVILSTGERYRYISGAKNDIKSYIISNYNYLYHNYSDLHINYNLKNKTNYIYNTKKLCDQKIKIINAENTKKSYEARVKEKRLYAIYVDEYGNPLKFNDKRLKKYIKIYSYFILNTPLRYDKCYIDFSCLVDNFTNSEGIDSLIIFKNLKDNQALKKESDYLLYNENIETKWGDLINYDNFYTSELTKYFIDNRYINNLHPPSVYNNNFYKILINNGNYLYHRFKINSNGNIIDLNLKDNVYFNIHQKYTIDYGSYTTQSDYWKYNNYLPYMDINILPTGNDTNTSRSLLSANINNSLAHSKNYSGSIKISGIYENLNSEHNWESYISPQEGKYFWINLDIGPSGLRSALSPTRGFYSDSMRIDSPLLRLDSTSYTTSSNSAGCRAVFNPIISNNNTISISTANTFDFSHFNVMNTGSIFDISHIYCDKDRIDNCSNADCNISIIGTGSYSGNYSAYNYKFIKTSISNNIPYIISYDGGIYNTVGNSGLPYIQRHELAANNILFPISECDSSVSPRPANYSSSILNEEYQSVLANSIVNNHSNIVKYTDTMANEMLFRLIYGEQQKINYERIDLSNERVNLEDLYKYIHPRVGPKDLYKNIQYDMDITADCSTRKINGNISIDGVLALNKQVDIEIENVSFSLKIQRDTSTGAINVVLTHGSTVVYSKIHDTLEINESLIVSSGPISASEPNQSISLASSCTERPQIEINLTNFIPEAEVYNVDGCNRTVIKECVNGQGGELGEAPKVTAYFPHKHSCRLFSLPDLSGPCVCGKIDQCTGKASAPNNLPIHFMIHNRCGDNDEGYYGPDNRGVGDVVINANILDTIEADINVADGDYSRGVFRSCIANDPQFAMGLRTSMFNAGVNTNLGLIQDIPSTIPVPDYADPPSSLVESAPCYGIDSKDPAIGDEDRYNPLGRGYPPISTSTNDACECKNYTYGLCRSGGCDSETYNEFDYTFEYCKYNITLKGHSKK